MKTTFNLEKYFWDVNFKNLDVKAHKKYILERILEMGDEQAVKWMEKNFSKEDTLEVLKKSRQISPNSRNFWNLVFTK